MVIVVKSIVNKMKNEVSKISREIYFFGSI